MYIHIDANFGIADFFRGVNQTWLNFLCSKKGHVDEPYQDFYGDLMFNHYFGYGKAVSQCKRCHRLVREPVKKVGNKLTIPKLNRLVKKSKKASK